MKKSVNLFMVFLLFAMVVGCGQNNKDDNEIEQVDKPQPDYSEDVPAEPPAGMGFDITNEDVFETGYYCVQFDTFDTADVFFSSSNGSDAEIEWSVYIVDAELSTDEIDKLTEKEPVAINEGATTVEAGQWIYVLCSVNSKTAAEATVSTFSLYSFRDYI